MGPFLNTTGLPIFVTDLPPSKSDFKDVNDSIDSVFSFSGSFDLIIPVYVGTFNGLVLVVVLNSIYFEKNRLVYSLVLVDDVTNYII